jgi:hypothetical protein
MDSTYIDYWVKLLEGASQTAGATKELTKSYFDMRADNTIGNDDYFHCVGNFNAARKGDVASKIAEIVGDTKEVYDYYENQYLKNMSQSNAYDDYINDKGINQIGRQRAKDVVYLNSKEGCNSFRVNGINEKY